MKYRKKPVVIEALQWDGSTEGRERIKKHWPEMSTAAPRSNPDDRTVSWWVIETLEGHHVVSVGDFIIKGIKGEFYPCKPDIFELTYEVAE
jgi:hypothetical protein